MEEKKKEKRYTLAKIILGLIILILILLFVRSCAKIGIYLELEEKKYYVYHSTTFSLPKAKAYDNKGKKLNIEITIYKEGKEQEGIDTNHIGDKYVVYYKTYKRNMYLKKHIEVEIIRNPNLLGYTLNGISNIWTKEDVILTFVPNENNIEKYCVKGECSTNKEFTIEKNETFETYIIDEYGNKSLKNEYEVTNIDKESPIIKEVNEYNNKGKRYIGVKGEDTLSGVAEYSYDGGKTYSTSSTKEVSSGQIITIKIKDLVGNESEEYKYTVGNKQVEELPKDTKAPTFRVTKNPEANSIGWNKSNVTLTILAEDDLSGISSYSFDNGTTWETTNTKEISSTTTVKMKVKDNAGNISESKSVEVKIDKVFPVIGGIGDDYNERMEITIEEENLYNVELTKNGEDIINCPKNNNCIFSKKTVEGRGLYQVKATDKAGNETNTTFTIKARGDIPKIIGVINGNYYNESVTPYVEGEPIEEIKERTTLEKDNERIYSYEVGDTLEEEGVYYIQAKNRHNESDEVTFIIDKTLPELEIEKEGSELNIIARDKNLETVVIFKEGIPVVCFAPEAGEIEGVTCEEGNYVEEEGKKVLEYTYILEEAIEYEIVARDKAGNSTNNEFTYSIEEEPEEEIVEGSTLDWLVSEEINETGGYTLLAFIGEIENCINIEVLEDYYTEENIRSDYYYMMSGYETYEDILNKNAYKITIPNEVDGKKITELGGGLFTPFNFETEIAIEPYMRIQEVIIPEGIKTIMEKEDQYDDPVGAFMYDINLTTVTIPSSVKTIGGRAFYACNLSELIFKGSEDETSKLKVIEYQAFTGNNLTTLTIPSSVETIGEDAFAGNNLTEVTIPSSVTTIEYGAFFGNDLISLTFEENSKLKTIGEEAFRFNNLTGTLTIPSSVETIGQRAFGGDNSIDIGKDNINKITSLTFEGAMDGTSKLKVIGDEAFYDNDITGTLTIPSSVEEIRWYAFYGNDLISLTFENTIQHPSKLKTIGHRAFESNNLTSLIIPSSVETIVSSAFAENDLISLIFEDTIQHPSQLTTIGGGAFEINNLTTLTIPSSVSTIEEVAFAGNQLTTITIPSSVTTIKWGAFRDNQLTTLTIPSSVSTIEEAAFDTNPNLTTITVKRANSAGMVLDSYWNCKTPIYNMNYYCSVYYTINWDPS